MKLARLVVLGVALAAGLGAAYVMTGTKPPEPVPVPVAAPVVLPDAVLVASHDLTYGVVLTDADMRWQNWPKDQLPPGALVRSSNPNAMQDVKGSIVRASMTSGDLMRLDRLIKANGAGFMSAVLPTGTRAVAIDLSDQGKSAAGGFILPNDHVDVIRTFHPDDSQTSFASETILTNIRVLAIGQSVQDKVAERTVIGSTATLELTAEQAERVILAQRTGQLTLSLRSIVDMAAPTSTVLAQPQTMTIIRSGNAFQARVR